MTSIYVVERYIQDTNTQHICMQQPCPLQHDTQGVLRWLSFWHILFKTREGTLTLVLIRVLLCCLEMKKILKK